MGYVYLIGSSKHRWYKIGKTANAEVRVKELRLLLPFRLELVATWQVEHNGHLERWLHKEYKDYRINGEWFFFNPGDIRNLLLSVPHTPRLHSKVLDIDGEEIPLKASEMRKYWKRYDKEHEFTPLERKTRQLESMKKRYERLKSEGDDRPRMLDQITKIEKEVASLTGKDVLSR
jgi:hypothetical protein